MIERRGERGGLSNISQRGTRLLSKPPNGGPRAFQTRLDSPSLPAYFAALLAGGTTVPGHGIIAEGSQRMSATFGMGVPLCDLQAQYRDIRPQIDAVIARVIA